MTKQTINVGTSANDRQGDSLRTAFQKVNANFTDLYTALGLDSDTTLSLGAFEFTGSTMTTTDSTAITIDQATTVTSNLTVGGDILPSIANSGDLGSSTMPWRSLYVSNNTIYIGGIPLRIDDDNNLTVNGNQISGNGSSITTGDVPPNSPSLGDLWYDAIIGRIYVYYDNNWVDANPAGISSTNQLVNNAHTVSLGSDGTVTFPDSLTVANSVIGKSSSTTISEETPGGTISETTEIESQIEIATTGIVIAKRTRIIVDDTVTTSTDEAGSTLTVNNSTASIKHYVEPDGPNNSTYFQVSTSGVGAVLEGVNETLTGTDYGRVVASQSAVTIGSSVEGVVKYWLFDYLGGLTLPTPTSQVFTVTFDSNHYTPTVGKPSLELTSEPWQLEGQVIYEQNGTASLQLTNIWPTLVNPGYDSGDAFTFSTLVHGLSDYTLTITLNDVVFTGGVHWTANVGASQLPAYPSNISANGAIKLTAGNESFIFGADGSLHFPDGSFQGSAFVGLASTAQDLYKAGEIFIGIGDGVTTTQQWSFGTDGQLTVPGAIRKDGGLYLNSGGDGISSTVLVNGTAGSVVLRTDNGSSSKSLTFDVDGETTFPGRLNFADGSTYGNSTLTGAIDSDLALEVKHITTVSAEAFHGGVDDLIFDISEDDDITVVQPGWELNVGSELAPLWVPVAQASIDQSGNYEIRFSEDYNFEDFTTYTFRNPVPESKTWTIRSQTGGLVGPGGVIVTNETALLGGGGTYRELAIELPTADGQNDQRWAFANDGSLTLPQYHQIESDGSNATITLNGAASNESSIYLATNLDGETITTTFEMHPNGVGLNSVRSIDIHAGYDGGTFKYDFWQGEEAAWVEVRNQDAQLIAPDTRPWDGMPSYQAYTEIMLYTAPPGVLPQSDSLVVVASTAKAAYELWQAEQAAINVTVSATDKTWTFGNNGSITLPNGASIKDQPNDAIAFGEAAGSINQSGFGIAIGPSAGFSSQGGWAIAIGALAGYVSQGAESVAVGNQAGSTEQGAYSVAIGEQSGAITQGTQAVAIGPDAGRTSQGAQAIAIGNSAGYLNQHPNSIILNASGSALNSDGESRFYVNPIRNDSTQNNVLLYNTSTKEVTYDTLKGSGSWTVTTGTNTYSFEVTSGATYSLWVRGTTDNGVISWNATVTITNANLPALGQQFAYAYSGAGTLLDFTSIPNQIIGTSGAVTRSATTLGVPAGLFEFGINNTSPGDVTVYWGWTKI